MRAKSLEGLRGVAAFVVVIHHLLRSVPVLAFVYSDATNVSKGSTAWWLGFTPLHVIWAGDEAILVFLLLGSLLLTRARTASNAESWPQYYVRVIRLFLLVWAAVGLALVTIAIVPRGIISVSSPWVSQHPARMSRHDLIGDVVFVTRSGVGSNSVLWFIRWEVLFSLSFPLWIGVALLVRKFHLQQIVLGALGSMVFLAGEHRTVVIIAVLGLGVMTATNWDDLSRRLATSGLFAGRRAAAALVLTIVSGTWRWTRHGLGISGDGMLLVGVDNLAVVAAALLAMCLTITTNGWSTVLSHGALRYLGSRAFSLVLIHDPIIVAYAYLCHGSPNVLALFAVVLPFVLVVTELFYQVVELPVERLAGRVAKLIPNRRPPLPESVKF